MTASKVVTSLLIALILNTCGSQSFRYNVVEPVRYVPLPEATGTRTFTGEGEGFVWSNCKHVNVDAVDQLLSRARTAGYDSVADIKWFNYASA